MREQHYCRVDTNTGVYDCDHPCPKCKGEFITAEGACENCTVEILHQFPEETLIQRARESGDWKKFGMRRNG